MLMVIRRLPRLSAIAATLLALAVATGVALPRPRFLGRERSVRNLTVAGSTRPDQPCAWVFPDDADAEVAADAGHVPDTGSAPSRAWLALAAVAGLPPAATATLLDAAPPLPAFIDRPGQRRPAGRAPPLLDA
jgi:hypothetical protein